MAPSKETSCEGYLSVDALVQLLHNLSIGNNSLNETIMATTVEFADDIDDTEDGDGESNGDGSHRGSSDKGSNNSEGRRQLSKVAEGEKRSECDRRGLETNQVNVIEATITSLSNGPLAYLLSSVPILSTSQVPSIATQSILPPTNTLIDFTLRTTTEFTLLAAL